jgi:hypothetical protein
MPAHNSQKPLKMVFYPANADFTKDAPSMAFKVFSLAIFA